MTLMITTIQLQQKFYLSIGGILFKQGKIRYERNIQKNESIKDNKILATIERVGNKLPHPFLLFVLFSRLCYRSVIGTKLLWISNNKP